MLASILTSLEERRVLHRRGAPSRTRAVEEALYPAMEDLAFDFVAGKGAGAQTPAAHAQSVHGDRRAPLRAGALGAPLRDRFGVTFRLDFYETDDLIAIANRSANLLGIALDPEGAAMIAKRSRGRRRIVNRLLRQGRATTRRCARRVISTSRSQRPRSTSSASMRSVSTSWIGACSGVLCGTLGGHAVGVQTIAVSVQEDPDTIEDVVEPFLIRSGLLRANLPRAPRDCGRVPASRAALPAGAMGAAEAQTALFER